MKFLAFKFSSRAITASSIRSLELNIAKLRLVRMLVLSMGLAMPTLFTFWGLHGLTMTKMMGLEAIFGLTMVFTELPAGLLADRFGRKPAIVIGSSILLLAAVVYARANSFYWFMLAEICLGAGLSFIAGADESMLYDSLRALGRGNVFEKTWSKFVSAEMLYGGLCFLVGGTLAAWNIRAPFYLLVGCFSVLLVVSLTLKEPRCHTDQIRLSVPELLRTARGAFGNSASLRWLILLSAFLCAVNQGAFWSFQPYFVVADIPLVYNGVIFFALSLTTAVIAHFLPRAEERVGALKLSMLVIMAMSFCLMAMATVTQWWIVLLLPLFQSGRAFYRVSLSHFFHREAVATVRATIISARNMIDRICYSVVLLLIGVLVDEYGLSNALALLGTLSFVFGALIVAAKPKRHESVTLAELESVVEREAV